MTAVASICFLVGAALGLRFRVLILVPAVGFSAAVVAAGGFVNGESLWRLALLLVVGVTAIQLGYISGAFARLLFGLARSGLGSQAHERRRVSNAARTHSASSV